MFHVNDRLRTLEGHGATVRYVGTIPVWGDRTVALGVEWDDASLGKHDGVLDGVSYFHTDVAGSGSFLKSTSKRISRERNTFVEALEGAYGQEYHHLKVSFGSKKVEEFGLEKHAILQRKYAQLTSVSLDKQNIYSCGDSQVLAHLNKVTALDVSYNLFGDIGEVWSILAHIPQVEDVNLNGNRFTKFSPASCLCGKTVSLKLTDTNINLNQLRKYILPVFPNICELVIAGNGYLDVEKGVLDDYGLKLQTVDLSFNRLHEIPSINVSRLNVANNQIGLIPITPVNEKCTDLDLRYNKITKWEDIDALIKRFPSLKSLRINGNPLFEGMLVEEMTFNIVARLGLVEVNGAVVEPEEANNAELYFISKVLSGDYHYDKKNNGSRWNRLMEKHRINDTAISSSIKLVDAQHNEDDITVGLTVRFPDGTLALERRFLRSHAILRVKGIIGEQIDKNLVEMTLFYYTDCDDATTKRELEDNFSTIDNYGLSEGQTVFVQVPDIEHH